MIRLLLANLRFFRRIHLGVLLSTALAAAVLTGSLLVGDSVDGTLRKLALQRLGKIHYAMPLPHRFVSASLAERISSETAALLQLDGMAISSERQVNQVQVMGCDARFWRFAGLEFDLAAGEVALNQKLAAALQVKVGDEVSLRMEKPSLLSMDAPLSAQGVDRSVRGRYTVVRIFGDDELGCFGLSASQVAPCNAFVNLQGLQERIDRSGQANLLVSGEDDPSERLEQVWDPDDFGLHFVRHGELVQLESDGIYLDSVAGAAALSDAGAGTLTYLVNSLSSGGRSTPYSFVLAMDQGALADDEILVNRWLAEQLNVQIGDMVQMRYSALLPSGHFEERARSFLVKQILEMAALKLERDLAPPFPGLADVDRCADWDIGLPLNQAALLDEANEAYWERYHQTPKAVVPLRAGQAMWSNRFGALTSVRGSEELETTFRQNYQPAAAGYRFLPVRQQALRAVAQALDFGQLFVGMSFFLIASALLLTAMVFVFGIQQRAEEMGILLSMGWPARTIRRLLWGEGGIVAFVGSGLGAVLGIVYTKLLIYGLAHVWGGAVANTAIQFFAKPQTIWIGGLSAFICALLAMMLAIRRQVRHSVRDLLQADFVEEFNPSEGATVRRRWIGMSAIGLGIASIGIMIYSLLSMGQNVALSFFGAGALGLCAAILGCSVPLRRMGGTLGRATLAGLARRNAGRRVGRSLSVIALMASGCFLVFAVSSMQENVAAHADQPWSGTGGFKWFAQSSFAIQGGLDGVNLRVHDGDDASCLNLNRARAPRLLGVDPAAMSERGAFQEGGEVWNLLNTALPEGVVPGLVGDSDTAMWGLEAVTGVEKGDVLDYVDEHGNPFKVKLVGTLPMRLSVFQGSVLISEMPFVERYPSGSGYRMFLLDQRPDPKKYERLGLDVVPSVERLREFYAVESTYLSMFLVLGVLGLAVGSVGLGMVVLRNVQDRRAEMALLRAVGYRTAALRKLLLLEHGQLLLAGLGIGVFSAFVGMIPALFITRTHVSLASMAGLLLLVFCCAAGCMWGAVEISLRQDMMRGLRNE